MNKTIKAKKSLGQNFLIDQEALRDIANSIKIQEKHIIEVWPGYGALTEHIIANNPLTLDLVELDRDMVDILVGSYQLAVSRNEKTFVSTLIPDTWYLVTLHHQDVLTFSPPYEEYSIIANIPYYITSPILFHFLYPTFQDSNTPRFNSPQEMTIMMQKEVGEKILEGRAKKPHHSYLSLAMELACEDIEIVRYVGKESFDPAPKIDSIVLKFTVKQERDWEMEERFLALWRMAFTHPRKTLLSNLKWSHYDMDEVKKWLADCRYDEKVRAEAVGMEEWGRFTF